MQERKREGERACWGALGVLRDRCCTRCKMNKFAAKQSQPQKRSTCRERERERETSWHLAKHTVEERKVPSNYFSWRRVLSQSCLGDWCDAVWCEWCVVVRSQSIFFWALYSAREAWVRQASIVQQHDSQSTVLQTIFRAASECAKLIHNHSSLCEERIQTL